MKNTQRTKGVILLMVLISILLVIITIFFYFLYSLGNIVWAESVYITFMVFAYHIIMRLIVGEVVTLIYRKKNFNEHSFFFRIRPFENKIYKKIKVKKWKARIITAKPEQFDIKSCSIELVLKNMLQAEMVHTIIVLLSFFPIVLIIPYGAPVVFILTSIGSALIDFKYIIVQRYNRIRIKKLIDREKKKKK